MKINNIIDNITNLQYKELLLTKIKASLPYIEMNRLSCNKIYLNTADELIVYNLYNKTNDKLYPFLSVAKKPKIKFLPMLFGYTIRNFSIDIERNLDEFLLLKQNKDILICTPGDAYTVFMLKNENNKKELNKILNQYQYTLIPDYNFDFKQLYQTTVNE